MKNLSASFSWLRLPVPAGFVLLLLLSGNALAQKSSQFYILSHERDSFGIVEIRKGGYQFISPLLDCYAVSPPGLRTLKRIEEQLNDYIQQAKASGLASQISVYYRDMSNGPWLGIGEEELYAPASLLKLPIFIACLKYAQMYPDYPFRSIVYMKPGDGVPEIVTGEYIVPGQTYMIKELMERMMIYSDNEAKNILFQTLPQDVLNDIYLDLGISTENSSNPDEFMSVKEYASFFRILYNASYLSKEFSEYALDVMTRSAYQQGIVAGLPQGILVAHKFGERTFMETQVKQLHDCGIVYLDNHPYIICVMTRGKDFPQLQQVIGQVSKIVYETLKTGS